jgi:hypothetical protein
MANRQKRYHIYVNYFIQNDSWESISHPNLFVLPQEFTNLNDVKAQMVYDNFPLKNKQNFYLRFFLDDKTQGVKGWVDFPPNAVIPIYNDGHVYVKVLRLPKGVKINFKNQDVYKPKETAKANKGPNLIFMEDDKNQQKPPNMPPQNNAGFNQNMFSDLNKELNNINLNRNVNVNVNSNGGQVPPPQPQKQTNLENNSNQNKQNTLNLEDWGAFTGNNGSVGGVNMDNSNQSSNNNMNEVDPNLLNVFFNISSAPSQPIMDQPPNYDFTSSGNNNGNMNEIDKIPNNLPDDDIKDRVDPIINKWTLGGEGKKNLLFLLTTLHEVWTSPNLDIPDMQTLVNDKAAVRTFYKKAMRDLHADKNRDKDYKTKYVASCLYQALNEANSNY